MSFLLNLFKSSCCMYSNQEISVDDIIKTIDNILTHQISPSVEDVCVQTLYKLCQFTKSEYGMIGKIIYDKNNPTFETICVSNNAWNASSFAFYKMYLHEPSIVHSLDDLNLRELEENIPIIKNDSCIPKNKNLPNGHPPITNVIAVPPSFMTKANVVVILCNKNKQYKTKDITNLQKIMNILGYLFVELEYDQ